MDPTLTINFHDGLWATPPTVVAIRADGNTPIAGTWSLTSVTTSSVKFTFVGTPGASTSGFAIVFITQGAHP